MPSLNFKQNLNKAFGTQDAWINHASAVATGLFYPIVPKLLGLDGYTALAVGAGVPALVGALTDTPGALHASLGVVSAHLGYVYVAPAVFDDGQSWMLVDDAGGVSGLAESSIVTLPNGEQVTVYDYPVNASMNDYYEDPSVGEYITELSDYYSDDQAQSVSMNDEFQEFKF
jgi:hypothetical protein